MKLCSNILIIFYYTLINVSFRQPLSIVMKIIRFRFGALSKIDYLDFASQYNVRKMGPIKLFNVRIFKYELHKTI